MPALADPQPPLVDEIEVPRTRDGAEVVDALWVEYHSPYGPIPAKLVIAGGWTGREWAEWRRYEVAEAPTDLPGRMFVLDREPDHLLLLPLGADRSPYYETFIGPCPTLDKCSCRGHLAARQSEHFCKHVHALRWAVGRDLFNSTGDEDGGQISGGGEGGPEGTGGGGRADRRTEDPVREGTCGVP